jgi:hypothetical protein
MRDKESREQGRNSEEQGEETVDRAQVPQCPEGRSGAGPAETGAWAAGDPIRARVRPGWGRLGAPGASGAVLIQCHRSDGMRAINYCDKMQSWPAHCRRGGSIPVPSPTPVPCPSLLGWDASAHLSLHSPHYTLTPTGGQARQ